MDMETMGLRTGKALVGDTMVVSGVHKVITHKNAVMVDEWPNVHFRFADSSCTTVPCDDIVTILA
jgi:hypothetical protein